MRSKLQLGWLLAGLAALAGCGGATLHSTVTLDGKWQARLGLVGSSLTMVLAVQGANVTGTGSYVREAGRSGTLTVTGSETAAGHVSLAIAFDDGQTAAFDGAMQGDQLVGTWTSGGSSSPVTW